MSRTSASENLRLEDDVEIYVAWAHSAGINDLDRYTDRLVRLHHSSSDPGLRRQLRSGEDIAESTPLPAGTHGAFGSILPRLLRSKQRAAAEPVGPTEPDLTVIPFLKEGVDPGSSEKLLVKGTELVLLPPPGESDFHVVTFRDEADLARVLAGRVVMKIRTM